MSIRAGKRVLWRGEIIDGEDFGEGDFILDQADQSADYMALERDQRRVDQGLPPLSSVDKANWRSGKHHGGDGDRAISLRQFNADAKVFDRWLQSHETRRGALVTGIVWEYTFKTADGIFAYGPDKRDLWDERVIELTIRSQERAAIAELPAGTPISEIIRISQQTLTDPVGAALMQQVEIALAPTAQPVGLPTTPLQILLERVGIGQQIALPPLRVPEQVPAHFDQPSGPLNVLSQSQLAEREARQVLGQSSPLFLAAPLDEVQARAQEADVFHFWKANYPRVELLPADNPRLPASLLTTPFPAALRERFRPPLVRVKITPRKLLKPAGPLFGGFTPFIGIGLGLVPGVGPVLSAGFRMTVAINQDQKYGDGLQIPISRFAPQYNARPFWITLPVDVAQTAVKEPWFVPAIYANFSREQTELVEAAYARLL